jgi:hypothetical protein
MHFQYSADFYFWVVFCMLPSIGFFILLLSKQSRPWAIKAIEDSDDKPHQVDLTFLLTLVLGWLIGNAMLIGLGLYMFENKDTLLFCGECLGGVTLLWGLNKVVSKVTNKQ